MIEAIYSVSCLVSSCAHFSIGLLVLIWDLSWESLYRLQVIVIYDLICKYFSHFCHLAFYFTTVAFCRAKFLFLCNPTDFFLIIN